MWFSLIWTIVLLVGFILCVAKSLRNARSFRDCWPPIDDDEFVRRCGPGTDRDLAIRVRRVVSNCTGIEYERIYPEQDFIRDLD